ncbi:hypothetical protein ACJ73_10300, partial [Blastomyces percursus]
ALAFLGLTGPQGPHRTLFVAGQQLNSFAHSSQARAVLALPGQDVLFWSRFRPLPECRRLPGHFGGAYGNCKWRDHASRCSVRDGEDVVEVIDVLDSDDKGGNGGPRVITDGSTPAYAILIE